jgi:hypothetical protein
MNDGQVQAYFSDAANAEVTYQTSGAGADVSGGGVRINMIPLTRAVHRHVDLLHLLVAADVGVRHPHPRHQRRQPGVVARHRQRVEQLAVQDLRPLGALDVDHRRVAGHGDRLFERTDAEVGV